MTTTDLPPPGELPEIAVDPAAPYVCSFGCAGVDVSPEPSSATVGVGIQSMPATNER